MLMGDLRQIRVVYFLRSMRIVMASCVEVWMTTTACQLFNIEARGLFSAKRAVFVLGGGPGSIAKIFAEYHAALGMSVREG